MSHNSLGNGHDGVGEGQANFANNHSPIANPSTDPNLWANDRNQNQFTQANNPQNDANGGAGGNANSSSLAVEAARYDPFKGSELGDQANRARNPSTRGGFGYRSGPSFTAQKGLSGPFGQPGSPREISQPVSAMRTQDATGSPVSKDERPQVDGSGNESVGEGDASAIRVANAAFERDGGVAHNGGQMVDNMSTGDAGFSSAYGMPPSRPSDANRAQSSADGARGEHDHDASIVTMDDEGSSSFSQQDIGGKGAGTKRKKNFKYLQDESAGAAGPSSSRSSSEKRKKVQKACRPCKRSHMPCQEQRPCPRCLKRGIPELCIDAEPIARRPRKEGERQQEQDQQQQQQQQQTQQSLAQGLPFDYPEGMADIRQLAKAAHAANSALGSSAPRTPPLIDDAAGGDVAQEVPRVGEVLTQAGEVDALRSSLQPTAGDILDKYGYLPLRILADADVTPTSNDAGAPKDNFSWTRSYAELARWVVSDLPARVAAELDSVVTSQRTQLLQEGARVSNELSELEAASVASMDGAVHSVLEGIPLPVVLLRRSGEVYAKNTLASNTFGLLQPSTQDNFIKYGLGQHAISIAKLIKTATTDSLNYPVSEILPLITSSDASQPSAALAQSRFVLTMEAKEWVRASDVAGSAERSTRLPLFVTCVLTPLDVGAAAAAGGARIPLR